MSVSMDNGMTQGVEVVSPDDVCIIAQDVWASFLNVHIDQVAVDDAALAGLASVVGAVRVADAWFGAVVIYEDSDKRGRQPGEMQQLISAALRRARPGITCQFADTAEQALRTAVALAAGAPTLFLYEKLATAQAALAAIGAAAWPDAAVPLSGAAPTPGPQPGPQPAAEPGPDRELDPADTTLPDLKLPDLAASGGLAAEAAALADASADYEPVSEAADTPPALAVE